MDIKLTCGCKINIGLNVVAKRPDGYHDLETIFYPIPLLDELRITDSTHDDVRLAGHPLDGPAADNLVLKAVRLLRQEGFDVPPVCIDLHKHIPSGAGLGGGSSDAACVLKALNQELCLDLDDERMERMIAPLGADCPFFVKGRPVYAEGIGDRFSPVSLDLTGWHLVLVKPNDHISTREAYAMVVPRPAPYPLREVVKEPVETWQGRVTNDFEQSVFPSHPTVASIRQQLYALGAAYACMSGSGSTAFGLFREPISLAPFAGHFTFACRL